MLVCLIFALTRLAAVCSKGAKIDLQSTADLQNINVAPTPNDASTQPIVTIILPVYHEAQMMAQLVASMNAIAYPKDRLDIIIACEPDDPETVKAVMNRVGDMAHIKVIVTDGTGPKTKPNALNQALKCARGDIITVYDAEDRPHPDQIQAAVDALAARPDLAVVQAPLRFYNAHENWLTRQFAIEYAALFYTWVPFLAKINCPYPLGGTSNHIRRSALERVGGWDAHNVTEDADLSFRFAADGWANGYITPPTYEEAVNAFGPWIRQRSRWMKGYMQTWITHTNPAIRPHGFKGIIRQLTLQLTIGMTLVCGLLFLPGLMFAVLGGAWFLSAHSPATAFAAWALMALSYGAGIIIGLSGLRRSRQSRIYVSCIGMPIYWALLLIPTLKAIWELNVSPFFWQKTDHGRSTIAPKITDLEQIHFSEHPQS